MALALLDLAVPQLMKCGDPMDAFDLLKSLAPSAFDALTLVQVAVGTNVLTKDDLEALRDACARDSQVSAGRAPVLHADVSSCSLCQQSLAMTRVVEAWALGVALTGWRGVGSCESRGRGQRPAPRRHTARFGDSCAAPFICKLLQAVV